MGNEPMSCATAFGGAGPMHANAVAQLMGSFPILIPPAPGLLCATGDLVADFREEFARTFIRTTDSVSGEEVLNILEELGDEAEKWLAREGIETERQKVTHNIDVRYYRQGYEIPVEVDPQMLVKDGMEAVAEQFNQLHEQFYGFRMEGTACEIVNLRAVAVGAVPEPHLPQGEPGHGADASHAVVDEHKVYFEGSWLPTKIYDRGKLQPGNRIEGPAIVTEFDSTTVILAGYAAEVDQYFNLLINPVVK